MGDRNVDDSVQAHTEPKLCGICFQFFGNAACLDMCSKCYREHEDQAAKTQAVMDTADAVAEVAASGLPPPSTFLPPRDILSKVQSEPAITSSLNVTPSNINSPEITSTILHTHSDVIAESSASPQKNPNRCFTCNKRVGLTGFKCRCASVFCSEHRYSDKHSCTFDYKAANRDALTKANPTVVADKIQRI
mmetsp:Transcript_28092/g.38836  ORF Transcript_28092/g.38836 Transcript_28092/m.38836 type:complete len:191 (+) Transcript_28092:314-886(+)